MTKTTSTRRAGNLDAEVTAFIGRRQEAAEVKRLLSVSRLVTLTGVGGVGKTRLALRVGGELSRDVPDGVWLVDLAVLDDEGLLTQTVASALGIQEVVRADWPVSVIANHLRDKHLLLIMDNCEHLRDGCAVLIDVLLRQAPHVRVLATSRQTLGLTGEHVFSVPPLSLPDSGQEVRLAAIAHYEAVNLFVARAQAVRPAFELAESNVGAVAAICRRLDGIPLAIELAAARMSALSVHDLLERLEHRFQLLSVGSPTALPRHQTLRELVGWSWDLCSPEERTLWARISVFPYDFDLQAAEAVCAGDAVDSDVILDILTGLVEKTVVMVREDDGRSRYRMLDTLREYGQERLAAAGEEQSLREAHRRHYHQFVLAAGEDSFSARQRDWLTRLRLEHSNIRAALETSLEDPAHVDAALKMMVELWVYWIAGGRTIEARRWLDRGLRRSSTATPVRTRAIETCAYLCIVQGDIVGARSMLTEAREAAALEPDSANLTRAIQLEALACLSVGDLAGAEPLLLQVLGATRVSEDPMVVLDAHFCLAVVMALKGDLEEATELCRDAIRHCDVHGEIWSKSYMVWCLGFVALQAGDLAQAVVHGRDALRLGQSLDEPWTIASCLELLAWAAMAANNLPDAAHLVGAAEQLWGRTGVSLLGIRHLTDLHDRCVAALEEGLGKDRLAKVLAAGAATSLDEAVARGLGEPDGGPRRDAHHELPGLTRREREVATLIAQGLTNKSIAAQLVISPRTAEAHVERILNKLGFTSRAQVAAWVVEQRGS